MLLHGMDVSPLHGGFAVVRRSSQQPHRRKEAQQEANERKKREAASIEIIPFISEDMRDPKIKESPYFSIPERSQKSLVPSLRVGERLREVITAVESRVNREGSIEI